MRIFRQFQNCSLKAFYDERPAGKICECDASPRRSSGARWPVTRLTNNDFVET
jgi:hypothetical protein